MPSMRRASAASTIRRCSPSPVYLFLAGMMLFGISMMILGLDLGLPAALAVCAALGGPLSVLGFMAIREAVNHRHSWHLGPAASGAHRAHRDRLGDQHQRDHARHRWRRLGCHVDQVLLPVRRRRRGAAPRRLQAPLGRLGHGLSVCERVSEASIFGGLCASKRPHYLLFFAAAPPAAPLAA